MGMDLTMNRCSKSDNPHMKAKIIYAAQKLAETKTCFRMLEHDLMKGMAEAKEIFTSMSVPLMQLVGLKVQELAEDGRHTFVSLCPTSEALLASPSSKLCAHNKALSRFTLADGCTYGFKEENMKAKAAQHVADFLALQKEQVHQLFGVVKMVEKLVRSLEEAIGNLFQTCEGSFESLQRSSLVHLKKLHQEVVDMRKQGCNTSHRLRVAEQSYQALMSLVVKLQEYGIHKVKQNLCDVKIEVEEMVNELANNMCQPLIAFVKEQKTNNEAASVVLKLQSLVEHLDYSKISSAFQMLSTEYDNVRAHAKSVGLQLEAQKVEMEVLFKERESMCRSLKEKMRDVESLEKALEKETTEKRNLKVLLDSERLRPSTNVVALRQNEAKLSESLEHLKVAKEQIANEHLKIIEACEKSRDLFNELSSIKERMSQVDGALEISGSVNVCKVIDTTKKSAENQSYASLNSATVQAKILQDIGQHDQHSLLWCQMSELFTKGMSETLLSDKVLENSEICQISAIKDAQTFMENSGQNLSQAGSLTKSCSPYVMQLAHSMCFLFTQSNNCKKVNMAGYSEVIQLCFQRLMEMVYEVERHVPNPSKSPGSPTHLVVAVAMVTMFQKMFEISSQGESNCFNAQHQQDERKDLIEDENSNGGTICYKSVVTSVGELPGNKRNNTNFATQYDSTQEFSSAKRLHTCDSEIIESKDPMECESTVTAKGEGVAEGDSNNANIQSECSSRCRENKYSLEGQNAALLALEDPQMNSCCPYGKELWQLLELGSTEDGQESEKSEKKLISTIVSKSLIVSKPSEPLRRRTSSRLRLRGIK